MRVLVTGGAGYIGAHVVRALAARGHEPVVLDDFRSSSRERCGTFPVEAVALEHASSVLDVFARRRPEAVIHLGGYISVGESVREPGKYWRNNLGAGTSLLLAAARHPLRVFVFSSTAAVYGEPERVPIPEDAPLRPTNPYGASKLAFEERLHDAAVPLGFRSVSLRYFNAAGAVPEWGIGEAHEPEEHLVPRVLRALASGDPVTVNGNDWPTEDGTCVRDYVHVGDLAEAHVRAIEAESLPPSISLNVGTGRGHGILSVIREAERATGRTAEVRFGPRRPGDPARLVADASNLERHLGFVPGRSSLAAIVDDAWAWELRRR